MGGISTSHGALLRGAKTHASSTFDLHSWQGLTNVLKAGKASLKDTNAYAEFRNLVLEYAQKGGDADIRKKIDSIIASFAKPQEEIVLQSPSVQDTNQSSRVKQEIKESVEKIPEVVRVVPVTQDTTNASIARQSQVGTRRIAPRFHINKNATETEETVVTLEKNTTPVQEINFIPEEIRKKEEFEEVVEVVQKVESSLPTQRIEPKEVSVPVEVPPVISAPIPPPPPVFKSLDEYKVRIAEIKRAVNAQVGNPATLIDTHNELGRAYMTALLTALKATGSGGTDGVDMAMAKLELAFTILLEHDKKEDEAETVVPEVSPLIQVDEKEDETEEVVGEEESEETNPKPADMQEETVEVPAAATRDEPPQVERSPYEPSTSFSKSDEVISQVVAQVQENKYSAKNTLASLFVNDDTNDTEIPVAPEPAPHAVEEEIPKTGEAPLPKEDISHSLSKFTLRGIGATKKEHIMEQSGVDPEAVLVKQSELVSPAITSALDKLLHDWSIFGGSGIFGIGPGGAEHPLYMKLATLSMGEVMAGRFEGSSPKLVKVIKEYIDAWRHEQGIAYTLNETFEHYLRRVVQRILKRQR